MTKSSLVQEKEAVKSKVLRVAEAVASKKAKDIKALDVYGLTLIADAFVLCSVGSEPQLKAVANAARESMRDAGCPPLRMEGDPRCGWLVLDFGDIILHVFREQARAFYDLDRMWGDAPEIPLNLDDN